MCTGEKLEFCKNISIYSKIFRVTVHLIDSSLERVENCCKNKSWTSGDGQRPQHARVFQQHVAAAAVRFRCKTRFGRDDESVQRRKSNLSLSVAGGKVTRQIPTHEQALALPTAHATNARHAHWDLPNAIAHCSFSIAHCPMSDTCHAQ